MLSPSLFRRLGCIAVLLAANLHLGAEEFVPVEDRDLVMPVLNVKFSEVQDTFGSGRSGARRHGATDILAPRGMPVVAVEGGTIARLSQGELGGRTIYLFDRSETYCYYYAHLDEYAAGIKVGNKVEQGQVIGFVGTTGNAPPDTPHLHFEITRLGPQKRTWEGTPVNPYPILREIARRQQR